MGAATRKAVKIAAKYKMLNKLIDAKGIEAVGARKEKRSMVSIGYHYNVNDPKDFHKAEKPNHGGTALRLNAGRSHLVTSF